VQSFSKLGIAKSAKSGGGKQLICRLIQMPFGSGHVSKMSNENAQRVAKFGLAHSGRGPPDADFFAELSVGGPW
jgi:hypothetical protein